MDIKLLSHQWDAVHSPTKNTLLLGGVGSGKTFAGCYFVLKQLSEQPDSVGFIGANTYQQLRDVAIASLLTFFDGINVKYTYNKVDSIIYVFGTKILCRSLDKYDNFRGIEIGWYWLDEVAYAKREAFDVVVGRLRDKHAKRHHGLLTTTPKGHNWLYSYFHESGELHTADYTMISASSYKNKHLPDGYIESLKTQYDEKLIQQELMGEFVNLTEGQAYYAFDAKKHVKDLSGFEGREYIGMDFNVDPMTCVIAKTNKQYIYIHSERFLRNADTHKMATQIKDYRHASIIPDSTGRNRSTTGRSNFDILKNHGFDVVYNRNPFVIDRVNNLNRLLDKGRIIIHPNCRKLINDLEKVSWREGKNELNQTTDRLLTHISDCLGYLAWYLFPIEYNKTNSYITFE